MTSKSELLDFPAGCELGEEYRSGYLPCTSPPSGEVKTGEKLLLSHKRHQDGALIDTVFTYFSLESNTVECKVQITRLHLYFHIFPSVWRSVCLPPTPLLSIVLHPYVLYCKSHYWKVKTKAVSSWTPQNCYQLEILVLWKPQSADTALPSPGGRGRRCMNANVAQLISSRWLTNGGWKGIKMAISCVQISSKEIKKWFSSLSEVGKKKSSRSELWVKYIHKRPFYHKRANVWRCNMLQNAILDFPIFSEHLNKKRRKLVLLPVTDGCHVHKDSLPKRNRCHHLKNFLRFFPQCKTLYYSIPWLLIRLTVRKQ